MFALALVPLCLIVGSAADFIRAHHAQTSLQAAADAAAVAAVTQASMKLSLADAQARAQQLFDGQAARIGQARAIKGTVTLSLVGSKRTSDVVFEGQMPTTLLSLAGRQTIAIGGRAKAAGAPPPYVDFHLLLDNTPSMGVAATPADAAKMVAATSDKCAFACHDISAKGNDSYALAKRLGVQMRIDVVRQASQKLMETAETSAVLPGQFRAGIWTFGPSCPGVGLTQVSGVTDNFAAIRSGAAAIDLMSIPSPGFFMDQCSDLKAALSAMNLSIAAPGDGMSQAHPQKVLFLVSDGVADAFDPLGCTQTIRGAGRCQEPINPAACKAIKDRGIRIAALYTTYLPLETDKHYNTWIKPFASQIGPSMQACASPGLYFEVSPTEGIADAMNALFYRVIAQTTRITD